MFAHVGGNLNNGANAGPRIWNLNNSSGNANWNIASQTLISKIIKIYLHPYILSAWKKLSRQRAWFSSENQTTMRLIRR